MAEHHNHDYEAPQVPLALGPMRTKALLTGLVGVVIWVALGLLNNQAYGEHHGGWRDFFLTWQIGFVFWVSVPIGSMALLLLAYMTSASWGLVFRRIFQASTRSLPYFAFILFIPIVVSLFMGQESSFWWVIPADQIDWVKGNPYVEHEQSHRQHMYLNPTRFLITSGVILLVYMCINACLNKWGLKSEDEKDHASWVKLRWLCGPGFIFWALSFTVLMTDWAMSVEPSWFSTMFPVVAGMNCFLTTFCFNALLLYTLVGSNADVLGILKNKFRIDIGSLIFGFCMVWSYASFSQYMLIWAGNMPEEILYYKKRLEGGWEFMAYTLMLVHWFLPFIILLFRPVKTDPRRMRWVATMLLFICMIDVTWWILPSVPHPYSWLHVPMAAAAIVAVGGLWLWYFFGQLAKRNLLPRKDTEFLATWGEHH